MRRRIAFTCASGFCCSLLHALQIRNDALGFAARLLHDAAGVRLGFLDVVLALVFHLLAELLGLVAQLDRLSRSPDAQSRARVLGHLTVIFRIGDNVLKAHRIACDSSFFASSMRFSGRPRLAADFKGVGLARHADGQAVGRAQRLHIELDGGVLHALAWTGRMPSVRCNASSPASAHGCSAIAAKSPVPVPRPQSGRCPRPVRRTAPDHPASPRA